MRVCNLCHIEKELKDFNRDSSRCLGREYRCRQCCLESTRSEKGLVISRKANKKYKLRNPLKIKAHCDLNNAIKMGKIERQPCKVFACYETAEAHHEDYSKPLDVQWLCVKHHKQLHLNKETK